VQLVDFWSIEIGQVRSPSMASTSGLSTWAKELAGIGATDFRRNDAGLQRKIVSKARELLPLPLTPVEHTRLLRGMV